MNTFSGQKCQNRNFCNLLSTSKMLRVFIRSTRTRTTSLTSEFGINQVLRKRDRQKSSIFLSDGSSIHDEPPLNASGMPLPGSYALLVVLWLASSFPNPLTAELGSRTSDRSSRSTTRSTFMFPGNGWFITNIHQSHLNGVLTLG